MVRKYLDTRPDLPGVFPMVTDCSQLGPVQVHSTSGPDPLLFRSLLRAPVGLLSPPSGTVFV